MASVVGMRIPGGRVPMLTRLAYTAVPNHCQYSGLWQVMASRKAILTQYVRSGRLPDPDAGIVEVIVGDDARLGEFEEQRRSQAGETVFATRRHRQHVAGPHVP